MSSVPSSSSRLVLGVLVLGGCLTGAAAQAQSSVSLYGLVDMSAGQFQAPGGAKSKQLQSGNMTTSYWGLKGSEDLGSGYATKFALESFLRADTGSAGRFGADTYFARSAWVGLSTPYGSLNLGRNTTSLFVSTLAFNAFGDSFGFSPSIRHYFTSSTVTGDTGWSSSASYTSPSFAGLTVQLQAATANGDGGRNIGGQLMYFKGPWGATLVSQKVKKGATVADTTTTQGGVSYDFGAAKLYGQYGKVDNDTSGASWKLADLGVAVPVGAGKVLAQWGRLDPATGATRNTLSLGYDHFLSKRTDVYAVFMNDKIDGLSAGRNLAVGMRHRF